MLGGGDGGVGAVAQWSCVRLLLGSPPPHVRGRGQAEIDRVGPDPRVIDTPGLQAKRTPVGSVCRHPPEQVVALPGGRGIKIVALPFSLRVHGKA